MSLCFYTDGPPLPDNAHGNHGIARNFIEILGQDLGMVLTRRYRRSVLPADIIKAAGNVPVKLHPDSSPFGVRRFFPTLAAMVDLLLFILWLPVLYLTLRIHHIDRVFILCGADAWFLFNVRLLQILGVNTDIYLVDDIEISTQHGHNRILKSVVGHLLSSAICNSPQIFAISQGFVDELNSRFHCDAKWLPLPSISPPPKDKVIAETETISSERHIVFIGGLNHLYIDALQDLYKTICDFNSQKNKKYNLFLKIISYTNPSHFISTLPHSDWVLGFEKLPDEERCNHLESSYACFLPYSFNPEEQLMVSTSFSCKILEYYASGRPILVYGPAYASIPKFFRNEKLPLCATNSEELHACLLDLENWSSSELVNLYYDVWNKHHSPTRIREILLNI